MTHLNTTQMPLEDDQLTVADVLESFLSSQPVSYQTIQCYKSCFRDFQRFTEREGYPVEYLSDFTREVMHRYVTSMKERGISPLTVNSRLAIIGKFFRWAQEEEFTNSDLLSVCPPKEPVPRSYNFKYFQEDEVIRLLRVPGKASYTGFRDYVLLVLMLTTGMRLREVLSMQAEHIDWDNGWVTILSTCHYVENHKDAFQVVPNYPRMREVPLTPLGVAALKELMCRTRLEFGEVKYVFVSRGKQLHQHSVRARIRNYGRMAELNDANPKTLRKTFIQSLLAGVSVHDLAKLVGISPLTLPESINNGTGMDIQEIHRRYPDLLEFLG